MWHEWQLHQCSGELASHPGLLYVFVKIHHKAADGCDFELSDYGVFCMRLDNGNP